MVKEDFALLPVYKPVGWTSTDVLNFLKKKFRLRRVGHTGTLDPFAEGLLVVLIGKATRLAEYYQKLPKTYRAVGVLGIDTDTYDLTGKVVLEEEPPEVDWESFNKVLEKFKGTYLQYPPPFSAKKVKGVRAYKLARKGERPELKPVKVEIYELKLLSFNPPRFEVETTVSGGTYVRSLIRDLGKALGSVAATEKLLRTAVGNISIDDAISIEELKKAKKLTPYLKVPDYGLTHLPSVKLSDDQLRQFSNGLTLEVKDLKEGTYRVYDKNGKFVAVGVVNEGGLKPEKVFTSR